MRRPLLALVTLRISLASSQTPAEIDSQRGALQDAGSFCAEWADAACNSQVVDRCAAESTDHCVGQQERSCKKLINADEYSNRTAFQCLGAVARAYADAELTASELKTVLGAQNECDSVVAGPGAADGACLRTSDCNTDRELECLFRPGNAVGSCQLPEGIEAGHDCSALSSVCGGEYYCDGSHCLSKKAAEEPCSNTEPCGADLHCPAGDDSHCQPTLDTGGECELDEQCASGLCALRTTESVGVCADSVVLNPLSPLCEQLR